MGHAEPAAGIASVAKLLVSIHRGFIPPNLHYNEPNPYIPGLFDESVKVTSFISLFIAVRSGCH